MKESSLHDTCDQDCDRSVMNIVSSLKENMLLHDTAVEIADTFKALGDPTRVKIIYALSQEELCVHDLTELINMGQSAISHQLRYLRNLRVVKRRKEGKTVFYSLDDHHIEQIFNQTLQHVKHV